MRKPLHTLEPRLLFFFATALFALVPRPAAAQCNNCAAISIPDTQVSVTTGNTVLSSSIPASSGLGRFTLAIKQYGTTPLPVNLPAGNYQAWCGTQPQDTSSQAAPFTATSNPGSTNPPLTTVVLNQLNYIINHKQGTIGDVQEAIWTILGTRSVDYLTANHLSPALAMVQAAQSNPNFTPAPGQKTLIILLSRSAGVQNLLAEVSNCGQIGDRVWLDTNSDGKQSLNEPGINGVTVQLIYQNQVIATTVTTPIPAEYSYTLKVSTIAVKNGWYQFTGLDCAGPYTVRIDKTQAALAGVTPATALVGTDRAVDSNGQVSPVNANYLESVVNLPAVNPAVDESIDFGFVGTPPLNLSCPAAEGFVAIAYTSSVNRTGGTAPYTFAVSAGALPPGLTLNATTGDITGTPTAIGAYAFEITVTDAAGKTAKITGCSILIKRRPLTVTCPATGGKVGDPYSVAFAIQGGLPPYRIEVTGGTLPPGLSLDETTGVVSGTPTEPGMFSFSYVVQDSTGDSAYIIPSNCGITIQADQPSLSCPANLSALAGTYYSSAPTRVGGLPPFAIALTSGALPPGLIMNPVTGAITGTPTTPGSYAYTALLTDAAGGISPPASCTITVGARFKVNCPVTIGTTGVPYNSAATVTGGAGSYTFALAGSLPPGLTLNPANGSITGTPTAAGTYAFTIRVTDSSTNPATVEEASCSITIGVAAACPPVQTVAAGQFYTGSLAGIGGAAPYTFSNVVGVPPGMTLSSTGVLSGTPTTAGTFGFSATVTDANGKTGTIACTLLVTVTATCPASTVGVVGNAYTGALTGVGGTPGYTFLNPIGLPDGLTMTSAGVISGTPTTAGTFSFTVTVRDSAGMTGTVNCTLRIEPAISANCASITAAEGVAMTPVQLTAAGGVGGSYTFSATGLPAGLTISSSGLISGTPTQTGTVSYTVTVTDASGNTGTSNCSITVTPAPPITTNCAAIVAVKGVAITPVTMTAAGGVGSSYTFSATGLPAGLTMSSTGTISGTPTVSGTFGYTVTISDGNGHSGTANCSVTVEPPPVVANCANITAAEGVAITPVQLTATGGVDGATYTFSATGLPAGLMMSTGGLISGTPTVSGSFSYTVIVSDGAGHTGTSTCSVTVTPAPPVTANCANIIANQGVAITPVQLTATGGIGSSYAFSATGLPAGLTMSSTGTISGTPTVSGTFTYTVTVNDGKGHTGTGACSVTVEPPPVVANCASLSVVRGAAISPVQLTAAGGVDGAQYTFSVQGLPAGLNFTSGGLISGAPTVSGTFHITVTVNDGAGHTGSITCQMIVQPPPVVANCANITAAEGMAMTPVQLTATGGAGTTYTFSAVGLPAGITMTAGGLISGTPVVGGTFSYTVTVSDGAGHTGTSTCSVTIAPAPPVAANCANITASQGVAITPVQLTATGGVGSTYTFSAAGLPAGITMTSGGLVSGTPAISGAFPYSVTVSDGKGHTATSTCSVTVNAPVTANCIAITAMQGVAITPVTLTASGGAGGPYTFTATGLPAGLAMSASGTISGTPTVSGTFAYTAVIRDRNNTTTTATCSVTVTPVAICAPATFDMTGGNSASTGSPNIRAFTAPNGVQVKASAWSRDKSTGAWAAGWLGAFSPGLGVTDTSEDGSDPGHRVDNVGSRVNYVMFEFSSPVTVNRAYLASVGGDSDISVWIGTANNPFANHLTLSDAVLAGFGSPETNTASNGNDRWADFNGSNASGNVLVIAARTTDTSSFDEFKIAKIETSCNAPTVPTPTASCVTVNAVQGTAMTPVTMAGSGGAGGPYTFSATGLPAGLAMSSDGTISGTPAVTGTFSYTVTVKDKNNVAGTASCSVTVTQAPVCAPTTFTMTGTTSSVGTAGNIRTFTAANGVQVKVSGWGRNKTSGVWSTGFVGAYSSGLGVTDVSEDGSDPHHRVDNVGTHANYLMFEFSQPVTVNRVYLDAVNQDSDISVWIGSKTNPFTNHITLSDAVLSSLGTTETNDATTAAARWADINTGNVSGNVLVVAASLSDTSPDDYFKIAKIETTCSTTAAAPAASCVAITAAQGIAITPATMTATGGAGGPYTFSATGLPAGLAMSSTGTISGTPTVSGTFAYTVTVKDKNGVAGTVSCSVTVAAPPAPAIACASIAAVQGVAITPVTMTATGGAGAPYTFSANGLPAGLTMSSTGTISGTPTVSGTFTYIVTVKDKNNVAGTVNCSVTVTAAPVCAPATFSLDGNTAGAGTAGNVRTFTTSNGVQVKASAWGRNKNTGAWTPAFLGSYSAGLGVTDSSEDGSDPGHRVDNVGSQVNYVMFEFSQPVVVNRIYLDAVSGDSDISAWIGTRANPFTNHITLNDSVVSTLGTFEENQTTSSADRWADINGVNLSGNVLIVAAMASDDSPEDYFKISKIETSCNTTPSAIAAGEFTTYTQGGWGASPSGNNPGMVLKNNWTAVYPGGSAQIGGTYKLTFNSAAAIANFLPEGGSAAKLTASATNPTNSAAGVIAGQLLALQLNVDFSTKGVTRYGLGSLYVVAGPMAGKTVQEVLTIANTVVGGGSLPNGLTISEINSTLDAINNNFDNGTSNDGYLRR